MHTQGIGTQTSASSPCANYSPCTICMHRPKNVFFAYICHSPATILACIVHTQYRERYTRALHLESRRAALQSKRATPCCVRPLLRLSTLEMCKLLVNNNKKNTRSRRERNTVNFDTRRDRSWFKAQNDGLFMVRTIVRSYMRRRAKVCAHGRTTSGCCEVFALIL